jgi:hypothetical protein
MNKRIVLCFLIAIPFSLFAQSPFNYGHNKKVYFISAEQRQQLAIDTIYEVDQAYEGDEGGMGQNWDVQLLTFDNSSVTDGWYPISLDSTFQFSLDSIKTKLYYLNGSEYNLAGGQLTSYGGGGYGSFDWYEIFWPNDTASVVVKSCRGHCGDQPEQFSKNVFNKKGQLIYIVHYPTPQSDYYDDAEWTMEQYERFLKSGIAEDITPDTTFYTYNKKGLLMKYNDEYKIDSAKNPRKLFNGSGDWFFSAFHQCYVGLVEMEKYVKQHLNFLPELLLIEIYRYGVFSFTLNSKDEKYYRTMDIVLQQ